MPPTFAEDLAFAENLAFEQNVTLDQNLTLDQKTSLRVLETAPPRAFASARSWPPHPAALAALVDLGMSVPSIACYFGAPCADVARLCDRHALFDRRHGRSVRAR